MLGMVAGDTFYSLGTIFHVRKAQRFRYSIWRSFVMMGGACFFVAIWVAVVGGLNILVVLNLIQYLPRQARTDGDSETSSG